MAGTGGRRLRLTKAVPKSGALQHDRSIRLGRTAVNLGREL
jgi:hypothetical protein